MLKNYYVFALVVALATAVLAWLYARTLEGQKDSEAPGKTFYKTLAAGVVAGGALAWFVSRPEEVLTEPFSE